MRGHRVTEPFLPNHQTLVGESAQSSRQPLGMREPKDDGGHQKRHPSELAERNGLKIRFGDVAIDERTIENFFERRHDQ